MMAPYKGLARKPMRQQLRGEQRKMKPVRTDQRRRHGKDLMPYRKKKDEVDFWEVVHTPSNHRLATIANPDRGHSIFQQ